MASRIDRNKAATVTVKKNSARLTEPIVVRGSLPAPTSDVVAIGPQPPPPVVSIKPPTKASGTTLRAVKLR